MAAVSGAMVSSGSAACAGTGRSRASGVAAVGATGVARGRSPLTYADRRFVTVRIPATRLVDVFLTETAEGTAMNVAGRSYNIPDYTAGDTLVIQFTIKSSGGAATDLTRATFRYSVAPFERGRIGTALFTKEIGDGIEVVSASGGVVRVTVDEGDIPAAGTYWHELECVLGSGASYTAASGRIAAAAALLVS